MEKVGMCSLDDVKPLSEALIENMTEDQKYYLYHTFLGSYYENRL